MTTLRTTFHNWWRPPRRAGEQTERTVSFLELFYDLVYVVLIAEIAHGLAEHVSPAGALGYVFLFIIIWWAWLNGALYHDLHGQNDLRTRVFTFLQMMTVAAMAVFAHNALGEGSIGFALSFVAYQLILSYLWWRTGVHDPRHRPFSRPYTTVFLFTTLLFFASIFVPAPGRFYLWGAAMVISLLLPLSVFTLDRRNPELAPDIEGFLTYRPSTVERFGLLTIIVLGEVIVGAVQGLSGRHHLDLLSFVTGGLGMGIAVALWWVYFDFVSHRPPITSRPAVTSWIYAHLFMTMGIAATGAAVLNVIELSGEPLTAGVRWLLVGAVSLALASIAVIMSAIQLPEPLRPPYRTGRLITGLAALIILLLGFTSLSALPLVVILLLLMLTPVFYGIKVWITRLGAEDISPH